MSNEDFSKPSDRQSILDYAQSELNSWNVQYQKERVLRDVYNEAYNAGWQECYDQHELGIERYLDLKDMFDELQTAFYDLQELHTTLRCEHTQLEQQHTHWKNEHNYTVLWDRIRTAETALEDYKRIHETDRIHDRLEEYTQGYRDRAEQVMDNAQATDRLRQLQEAYDLVQQQYQVTIKAAQDNLQRAENLQTQVTNLTNDLRRLWKIIDALPVTIRDDFDPVPF